jgi:hypothetical protein
MIGSWWENVQRPMRPPTVVMCAVLGEDSPQVPLSEDQHAVSEFGSSCQHESFGEAVRSRAARRNPHGFDTRAGQGSVERRGELSSAVADEELEFCRAVAEVHQEVPGLLSGPGSVGVRGCAEDVHVAAADFQGKEDVDPLERHRAVHMEEVHGQHGRGLRPQELPPRTGRSARIDDVDVSGAHGELATRDWGLCSSVGVPVSVEGRLWAS